MSRKRKKQRTPSARLMAAGKVFCYIMLALMLICRMMEDPGILARAFSWFLAITAWLVGAASTLDALDEARKLRRCTQPVEATVRDYVTDEEKTDEDGNTSSTLRVRFRYAFAGKEYMCVLKEYRSKKAQRMVKEYPICRQVTLYINPAQPCEASDRCGTDRRQYVRSMAYVLLVGLTFAALGLLAALKAHIIL